MERFPRTKRGFQGLRVDILIQKIFQGEKVDVLIILTEQSSKD